MTRPDVGDPGSRVENPVEVVLSDPSRRGRRAPSRAAPSVDLGQRSLVRRCASLAVRVPNRQPTFGTCGYALSRRGSHRGGCLANCVDHLSPTRDEETTELASDHRLADALLPETARRIVLPCPPDIQQLRDLSPSTDYSTSTSRLREAKERAHAGHIRIITSSCPRAQPNTPRTLNHRSRAGRTSLSVPSTRTLPRSLRENDDAVACRGSSRRTLRYRHPRTDR